MREEATPLELHSKLGTAAWAGLIVLAGVYDYFAEDTLSEAYRRNFRAHPVAVGVTSLGLAAHLLRPDSLAKYDPMTRGLDFIKRM